MSSKLSTLPSSVEISRCIQCRRSLPAQAAYCLYCGASQQESAVRERHETGREGLHETDWTSGSLIALVLGLACLFAAVATGALFSQRNVHDWQAVQAWRLEWLAAGIACFLLSLCLQGLRGGDKN